MDDRHRRGFILRVVPALMAAMLATATVGGMDTVPFDVWHDVIAWVGAGFLALSAIWPRRVICRLVGASATAGAITGRLTWWLIVGRATVDAWQLLYAVSVLALLLATVVMWAWSADYLVARDDDADASI